MNINKINLVSFKGVERKTAQKEFDKCKTDKEKAECRKLITRAFFADYYDISAEGDKYRLTRTKKEPLNLDYMSQKGTCNSFKEAVESAERASNEIKEATLLVNENLVIPTQEIINRYTK